MKHKLDIQKKNAANIGTVEGHNKRRHSTLSQLPQEAWINKVGTYEIIPFNQELLKKCKSLAKRKDAVLAIELVAQVGNQTDWREMPTEEYPFGKPKAGNSAKLNKLIAGVKEAAFNEFGEDRVISMDLHLDESTPHIHFVVAPIVEGKLQAKKWLNGAKSCAALRERIHADMSKHIESEYEKGVPKGGPHDSSKAAGASNGPQPKPGMLAAAAEALSGSAEIKKLKQVVVDLNQKLQNMFSQLKKAHKKAAEETEKRKEAEKKAEAADLIARKANREIVVLKREIEKLTPKKEEVVMKPDFSEKLGSVNTNSPKPRGPVIR